MIKYCNEKQEGKRVAILNVADKESFMEKMPFKQSSKGDGYLGRVLGL